MQPTLQHHVLCPKNITLMRLFLIVSVALSVDTEINPSVLGKMTCALIRNDAGGLKFTVHSKKIY